MANDYIPSWQRKLTPEPEPPKPDPVAEHVAMLAQHMRAFTERVEELIELEQSNRPEPALPPDVTPIASEVAKMREVLLRAGSTSPPSDPEVVRLLRELLDHERDEGRWNALMETLRKASQDGARAVVSTGASGNAQNVGIKDSSSNRIDPATEQKQDSALTELQSLVAKDFATQTTLAALAAEDFATQATLASVLSDLQAKRDGTEAEPIYTSSPVAAKIATGDFFLFSSSRSVTSGTEGTWSIENPAGSGKAIYIVQVGAATDNTSQIRFEVYKNSTITGGTTRTPWDPNFASASTSVATVKDGTGIRSGGTQLEAAVAVVRDHPFEFEGLVVIPPGSSLQLTGVVPGALSAQQLTVGARWYEE